MDIKLKEKVNEVLEKAIRPYIQSHGGDVSLIDIEDGVVTVSLTGACAGCPSADLGTKAMIEEVLREQIPEIEEVELSRNISSEMADLVSKILHHEIELD